MFPQDTNTTDYRDAMEANIRAKRLMLHRIVVCAQEIHANPAADGTDRSQCPCHPVNALSITLEQLAGIHTGNVARVRPAAVKELAERIECCLKRRLGDPYQAVDAGPETRQALDHVRKMIDAAIQAAKHQKLERRCVNRIISMQDRDSKATAQDVSRALTAKLLAGK